MLLMRQWVIGAFSSCVVSPATDHRRVGGACCCSGKGGLARGCNVLSVGQRVVGPRGECFVDPAICVGCRP